MIRALLLTQHAPGSFDPEVADALQTLAFAVEQAFEDGERLPTPVLRAWIELGFQARIADERGGR